MNAGASSMNNVLSGFKFSGCPLLLRAYWVLMNNCARTMRGNLNCPKQTGICSNPNYGQVKTQGSIAHERYLLIFYLFFLS